MDVRLASLAWLGMHNYTYLWLKASGPRSAHEVAATFADFFVNGIGGSPPSGQGAA